jgi:[ribosomal protein S18]-alanine N-acetyltransferase
MNASLSHFGRPILSTIYCYSLGTVQLVVREYRPEDFEALWRIDQACFAPGVSYSRPELAYHINRKPAVSLVAELAGKPAGFVIAVRERNHQGHIITIDVLAEARRSGVGSRLMAAAEERLRALGSTAVFLETAVDNDGALAFYKRHGYTIVNAIPRYYLNRIDALVLAKDLSPEGSLET